MYGKAHAIGGLSHQNHHLRRMRQTYINRPRELQWITAQPALLPNISRLSILSVNAFSKIWSIIANNILDLYRMDPRIWEPALCQLQTLKAKAWIEGVLIDLWLLDMWRSRYRQTPFRFLPSQFIQVAQNAALHAEDSDRERGEVVKQIKTFRRYFDDLPQLEHESCELEDSICVLNTGGNHYCVVIFMPQTRCIHVLGRKYSTIRRSKGSKDWVEWGGPRIWAWVCKLYGWSEDQVRGMSVNSVDWHQNGYDCGPTACQIVESIWVRGLALDGEGLWKGPNLPCCHAQRLTMAIKVHQLAIDGHRKFLAGVDIYPHQIMEYLDDELDGFVNEAVAIQQKLSQHPSYALKPVEANLRLAILSCRSCRSTVNREVSRPFVRTTPDVRKFGQDR